MGGRAAGPAGGSSLGRPLCWADSGWPPQGGNASAFLSPPARTRVSPADTPGSASHRGARGPTAPSRRHGQCATTERHGGEAGCEEAPRGPEPQQGGLPGKAVSHAPSGGRLRRPEPPPWRPVLLGQVWAHGSSQRAEHRLQGRGAGGGCPAAGTGAPSRTWPGAASASGRGRPCRLCRGGGWGAGGAGLPCVPRVRSIRGGGASQVCKMLVPTCSPDG